MGKLLRIMQWIAGGIVTIIGGYNLYREEFNPAAPLLGNILDDWPWWFWGILLILLFFLPTIVKWINEVLNGDQAEISSVSSKADNQSQSVAFGGDMHGDVNLYSG